MKNALGLVALVLLVPGGIFLAIALVVRSRRRRAQDLGQVSAGWLERGGGGL